LEQHWFLLEHEAPSAFKVHVGAAGTGAATGADVGATFVGISVVGALLGAFVVRVQVGNIDGEFVLRVEVGNKDGTPFVGTSVSEAVVRVCVVGALVGALVGAEVGSGANTKITGGVRGIKHWRAVKACELKIPADDPTIKRARMATERSMAITASSNKSILYLENKTVKVLGL
jgi:hypothetical protein